MNRTLAWTLGLLVVASLAHADVTPTTTQTGDRKMDAILGRMNAEAKADPDAFVTRLSTMFKVPEQDVRQARDTHGLDPAGLYMSAALANATQKPMMTVAEDYKKNPGRGWGAMAEEMGIKPGSPEFQQLKRNGQGCLDGMRADKKMKAKHEKMRADEHKEKGEPGGKGAGRDR